MKTNLPIENISSKLLYLLLFLLPIYFLPLTFDVVELNKSILLVIFSILFLILLTIKSYYSKRIDFTLSYLTFPLCFLLFSFFLSAVFSVSTSYSLWGFYGSLSNSLPIIFLLILLAINLPSIISSYNDVKNAPFYFLIGLFLVHLYAIANYFNLFQFFEKTVFSLLSNLNFTPLGSISDLRFTSLIGTFFGTYYLLTSESLSKKAFSSVSIVFSLICSSIYFSYLNFIICITLSLLTVLVFRIYANKKNLSLLAWSLFLGLVFILMYLNPQLKKAFLIERELPVIKTIDNKTYWYVSNAVIGDRPLFGTGVGTFVQSFTKYKPLSLNNTEFWDTRFIKPSSFYLLVLSETGLLGFLSFLILIVKILLNTLDKDSLMMLKKALRYENYQDMKVEDLKVIKVTVLLFLVFFMFSSGNVFVLGSFFIFLGLLQGLEKLNNTEKAHNKGFSFILGDSSSPAEVSSLTFGGYTLLNPSKLYVLVTGITFVLTSIFVYRVFVADLVFRSFFNTPKDLLTLRNSYINASKINPKNDFYQRSIIEVDKEIIKALASDINDLSQDEKDKRLNSIKSLLQEASLRSRYITSDTDLGVNSMNWESRGLLFQSLIGVVDQADMTSLQSYLMTANNLDPLNPRILATIGTVYFNTKNYQQAANFFQRAIFLKNDYAAARYNLAKTLEKLERYSEAYGLALTVLDILPSESKDYEIAKNYTDLLRDLIPKENNIESNKISLDNSSEGESQSALTDPNEPLEQSAVRQNSTLPLSTGLEEYELPQEPDDLILGDGDEIPNPSISPSPSSSPTPDGNTLPNQENSKDGDSGFIERPSED